MKSINSTFMASSTSVTVKSSAGAGPSGRGGAATAGGAGAGAGAAVTGAFVATGGTMAEGVFAMSGGLVATSVLAKVASGLSLATLSFGSVVAGGGPRLACPTLGDNVKVLSESALKNVGTPEGYSKMLPVSSSVIVDAVLSNRKEWWWTRGSLAE